MWLKPIRSFSFLLVSSKGKIGGGIVVKKRVVAGFRDGTGTGGDKGEEKE
jgi:hypothetical protein